ncbi:hypothetical protein M0804_013155 [Polistes exclamans]|nr:hypothetical protein M0804_013155 [Polistes exclamans]
MTDNEDSDPDVTADGTGDLDNASWLATPTLEDENTDVEISSDYERLYFPHARSSINNNIIKITENVGISRDSLQLRHDNIVIFTDLNGTPCDTGAKLLEQTKLIPHVKDLTLARAKVTDIGKNKLIIIPIKENIANSTKLETIYEAIGSLLSVVRELNLKSVSIAKTQCLDGILWPQIQRKLYVHTNVALDNTYLEYYLDLVNKIKTSQNIARQNLVGAKIRSKVYYDRKARGQNLVVGHQDKAGVILIGEQMVSLSTRHFLQQHYQVYKQFDRYCDIGTDLNTPDMSTRDASRLTAATLKELLQRRGLSTCGTKAELMARLYDFDPSGEWVPNFSGDDVRSQAADGQINEFGEAAGDDLTHDRREMDFLRREKALMEKELECSECQREEIQASAGKRPE